MNQRPTHITRADLHAALEQLGLGDRANQIYEIRISPTEAVIRYCRWRTRLSVAVVGEYTPNAEGRTHLIDGTDEIATDTHVIPIV